MNDTRLWRLSQRRQWWRSDAGWLGAVGDLFEGWSFELVRSDLLIEWLDTTTTTQAKQPLLVGKTPVYFKCWVYYSVIIIQVKYIWMHWICVTFQYTWVDQHGDEMRSKTVLELWIRFYYDQKEMGQVYRVFPLKWWGEEVQRCYLLHKFHHCT